MAGGAVGMWQRGRRLCAILCTAAVGSLALPFPSVVDAADDVAAPSAAAAPAKLNFEDDIVPIFETRCFKCHGAEMREAGVDLRGRLTMSTGGVGGADS